jgi:HTH-type transcriptional regulator/antitoxin HipB
VDQEIREGAHLQSPKSKRLTSPKRLIATIMAVTEGSRPEEECFMDRFSLETPEQVSQKLAARAKALRLARGWKQSTLAERSGVTLASLRRFEDSGKVSLQSLLDLAFALNRLDDFEALLQPPRASSLAELEVAEQRPARKRGRV